jgi:hypothetical protein
MTTILAYWQDKTFTILQARTMWELFDQLDYEGDPSRPCLRILPSGFAIAISRKHHPSLMHTELASSIAKLPKIKIMDIYKAINDKFGDDAEASNVWLYDKTIKQAMKLVS